MKYMCLIYDDENRTEPSEVSDARNQRYFGFTEELTAAGAMVAGDALEPSSTATTVRVRDGETITTDGPFAETKEVLLGFYIVEAEDLDEAIAWAAKIPSAEVGSIEVRPVMDYSG